MEASATQETTVQTPPQSPFSRLTGKFRNLSKKQKIIIGAVLLIVLVGILAFIWSGNKGGTDRDAKIIIAKVGDKTLPKSFENLELQFLPGAPTAEIEKVIKEKLVNDQITLDAAQKEGLISGYPDSPTMSKEEYLKRTGLVAEVKKKVDDKGNVIKGKMVMVWFYNNKFIGTRGPEGNKQFAYSKIKPVYERVKKGEITIDEAGRILREDKSIKEIDPVWEVNALDSFVYYKNGKSTFWPGFNEILWNTEPGQITPLYLGGGILREGKPVEELYIFAEVEGKSNSRSYNDYQDWLEQKRQEYKTEYTGASAVLNEFTPKVFAEESYGQGGYDGGYGNEGNSGNGSGGGENPENTVRSGDWYGRVTTATGLPLPGAQVQILNGCLPSNGLNMTTDANGSYNTIFTGAGTNLSCMCNPQEGRAYYNGVLCEKKGPIYMGNGSASVEVHFRCDMPSSPGPSGTPLQSSVPTPTPSPCSPLPAETRNVACPPNHTGTIVETRTSACPGPNWSAWTVVSNTCTPPPACGDSCTSDSYCFGAPDGCTSCVPNNAGTGSVCSKPPVCGSSCVRDSQCIGAAARDGCTACVSGTCRIPPSCGTACTTRADCSGAKDNCSECLEGTCTDYNDNMCKCDGMTADMVYPGNSFKFEAFGKVEGGDIKKAQIADITFRMTQDNKVVAKSNPIVPTVVQNSGTKMRFKASWSTPPPPISKNSTYRVFADVRCKPKRIVASNGELASTQTIQKSEEPKLYPPKGLEWIVKTLAGWFSGGKVNPFVSEVLAQLSSPSPSPSGAQTNLQLQTLNFVKLMETDNCKFVMFKFDEALF